LRIIDRGNMIRADDPNGLAVVTQLQPIAVIFTIPQDEIARVQRRMHSGPPLVVEAYNRDFSIKLAAGELSALDNQVDSTTGTVRLKAKFDNQDEMLFPNQFVNVRLLIDTRRDAVIAPSAAVQRGPSFTFAYVLKGDSTVDLRKVQPGPTEGTEVIIEEGLAAGEKVVTDGLDKLRPGTAVVLRDGGKSSPSGSANAPSDAAGKQARPE
jgi:multidrug efflux system membrane fusion protein